MIVIGIDGGATKTHTLALDDEGRVVGFGVAGPSNYHIVGLDAALATFAAAARQALGDCRADFAVGCLAACDTPRDERRLTQGLQSLGFANAVRCYNDVFAPLRVGSRHPYGVAITCGTGFNACGIAPDGRTAQLASLGDWTGDWGGGNDFGTAAMGAAFRADDGRGEPTLLADMVLKALNVPDFMTLAERIIAREITRQQVGGLTPLVFEAAEAGDTVAQSIIKRLADEIVITAGAFLRRLSMDAMDVDVVLSGGLMHGRGTLLMDTIVAKLAERCPLAKIQRVRVAPVLGAALLAFDALHISPPTIAALPRELAMASMPT